MAKQRSSSRTRSASKKPAKKPIVGFKTSRLRKATRKVVSMLGKGRQSISRAGKKAGRVLRTAKKTTGKVAVTVTKVMATTAGAVAGIVESQMGEKKGSTGKPRK